MTEKVSCKSLLKTKLFQPTIYCKFTRHIPLCSSKNFTLLCSGILLVFNFACSDNKSAVKSENSAQTVKVSEKTIPAKKSLPDASLFEKNLPAEITSIGENDVVSRRILKDYGAIFIAQNGVAAPPQIIFKNEEECLAWQSQISTDRGNFGGIEIELQTAAMNALVAAREEIRAKNLNITARGTWAARRSYKDTEKIWSTRITPGLDFWTRRGKLNSAEAARIRALTPAEQIAEILRLEDKGIYFSKDFSKSVLYSATPPGASQHLSMLAVDVNENGNAIVRSIMAKHGWFQTVASDTPHFTYLGVSEEKLPALGLKKVTKDSRIYWIPDIN